MAALISISATLWSQLPSKQEIQEMTYLQPVQIFSRDGVLIGEIGTTKRYPQDIEQIPALLQSAFIAVEDVRFYQHCGVDFKALTRAMVAIVVSGRKVQGGSTITMQVARNFYLDRQKTYLRKFKEILLALKMETYLSKDKVLELYLNKIFLGHNSYGVEAASRTYFGKTIHELELDEMAILAGLPKAPSLLNPLHDSQKSQDRRNIVLHKMLEHGFIDFDQYTDASAKHTEARFFPRKIELHLPQVVQLVKETLEQHYRSSQWLNGAKVITTIDTNLQKQAQKALDRGLEKYDRRHSYRGAQELIKHGDEFLLPPLSQDAPLFPVAIENCSAQELTVFPVDSHGECLGESFTLSTDALKYVRFRQKNSLHLGGYEKDFSKFKPKQIIYLDKEQHFITQVPSINGAQVTLSKSGEILSLVGGLSYNGSQINRAILTKRQIGSTFKPFIYATALDQNFNIDTLLQDSPMVYEDRFGQKWTPQNDSRDYKGSITFEDSFLESRNLSTLSLGQKIDIDELYDRLSQILGRDIPKDLSTILGAYEMSPLELAQLYNVFVNQGHITKDVSIILTVDDQKYEADPMAEEMLESDALFSHEACFIMRYLMQKACSRYEISSTTPKGGKTGTTNDKQDLWFAGYKGEWTSVVWMGFDKPAPLYEYAAKNSAIVWNNALERVQEQALEDFPENIIFKIGPDKKERPYRRSLSQGKSSYDLASLSEISGFSEQL